MATIADKIKFNRPAIKPEFLPKEVLKPLPAPDPPDPLDQPDQPDEVLSTKRKRPDKMVSGWESEFYRFRVVKMRLHKFVKNDNANFLNLINNNVKLMNRMIYLTYHFINFHFLRLLENNLTIPETIDQTFIQRVFQGITTLNGKFKKTRGDDEFKDSLVLFRDTLNKAIPDKPFSFPERLHNSFLITNLSQAISSAINNHLELNLISRLAKYLKNIEDETDGAKARYWAERIMNVRILNPEYPSKFDNDEKSEALILKFRNQLKIDHQKKIEVNNNLDIYLPLYYQILTQFKNTESKMFSLLPQKGEYGDNYIKIDTNSLMNLISQYTEKKGFYDMKMIDKKPFWKQFFNLRMVETQKIIFANEIVTNGYDVSITLQQQIKNFPIDYDLNWDLKKKVAYIENLRKIEKIENEKRKANKNQIKPEKSKTMSPKLQELEYRDYLIILGLDPGRRFLYTVFISHSEEDKKTQKLSCSSKEWRHLTGLSKDLKWRNNRKDKNPTIKVLNTISFKTPTTQQYLESLVKIIPELDKILKFYGQDCCKKRQFTRYIKTQKGYNKIIERLNLGTDGNKTVIGFGDGATNSNGSCKGAKVPGKSLYKKICQHDKSKCNNQSSIICDLVDENYTSKICSKCYASLMPIYKWKKITFKDGTTKNVKSKVYGLLRCMNNECGITWDRDINASRNIKQVTENLIQGKEHPYYLTKKHYNDAKLKFSKNQNAKQLEGGAPF